jgi:hypothetical protein
MYMLNDDCYDTEILALLGASALSTRLYQQQLVSRNQIPNFEEPQTGDTTAGTVRMSILIFRHAIGQVEP